MPRILIVKLGAIGDVLMAVPAAHQLHLAGNQIDWLCGPVVLPVLELYPWIHPIAADERALLTGSLQAKLRALLTIWKRLLAGPGEPYTLVATLYYDSRYRLITLPVRNRRSLHLSRQDRQRHLLPGRHHTDEFARILLDRPDQVTTHPLAPVAVPSRSLPRTSLAVSTGLRVVLAPAGARNLLADDALRRWPLERYVELARMLMKEGVEVILVGGPGDEWARDSFGSLPVKDLIGRLSLPETLAVLDACEVIVTHDTGPLHLAGITRVGIVALFGPTDPRGRLPQRAGAVALWGGEGFACRPCYDGHSFAPCPSNDCLGQIPPEMVLAEVLAMLRDREHGKFVEPHIVLPPSTVPAEISPTSTLVNIAPKGTL